MIQITCTGYSLDVVLLVCLCMQILTSIILYLYLLAQTSGNNLGYHTANGGMTPSASAQMFNPVRDNNTEGACPISATVSIYNYTP